MHAGIILVAVLCSIMAYNIFSVTREGLKAKKNKATSGKKPVVKKSNQKNQKNQTNQKQYLMLLLLLLQYLLLQQ